jgi:hypothetical protein
MRLDNGRVLIALVALTVASLGGCQSGGGSESDSVDTSVPAAQTDTAAGASPPQGDTTTVRADSVVVRTDKAEYRAGEAITLTLENRSASSYAFNPCTRSVEREENGSWSTVAEEGRMCTMEAWILDPKATREGKTELPEQLPPGRYRLVVRMTRGPPSDAPGSAVAAVSDAITVR